MRVSRLGAVAALLACVSSCTAPAAWRADLIAGREVAGVHAGEGGHDGTFVLFRIVKTLAEDGAIQSYDANRDWIRANGFVEGDLQDVEWFYTGFCIRGIVAVPRIPGGVDGWRDEARALGLDVVAFFGVSERRNEEYAHLYSTTARDVYLEIGGGHVRAIVRPIRPWEQPGTEATWLVQWFTEIDEEPRYMLHPWAGIQAECREFGARRREVLTQEMRLDEVVTPEVGDFLASQP